MFTFECLNHRAKLILASWEECGFDLRDFYVREEDGYTNVHCKYDYCHYKQEEVTALLRVAQTLINNTLEPYFFSNNNGHNNWRYYRPDGSWQVMSGDVLQPFNWPQQIERYRVALLLQATG